MTAGEIDTLIGAITALVVALTGLTVAVAKLWIAVKDNGRAINGRMDDLVASSRVIGHAEGVQLAHQLAHPAQVVRRRRRRASRPPDNTAAPG